MRRDAHALWLCARRGGEATPEWRAPAQTRSKGGLAPRLLVGVGDARAAGAEDASAVDAGGHGPTPLQQHSRQASQQQDPPRVRAILVDVSTGDLLAMHEGSAAPVLIQMGAGGGCGGEVLMSMEVRMRRSLSVGALQLPDAPLQEHSSAGTVSLRVGGGPLVTLALPGHWSAARALALVPAVEGWGAELSGYAQIGGGGGEERKAWWRKRAEEARAVAEAEAAMAGAAEGTLGAEAAAAAQAAAATAAVASAAAVVWSDDDSEEEAEMERAWLQAAVAAVAASAEARATGGGNAGGGGHSSAEEFPPELLLPAAAARHRLPGRLIPHQNLPPGGCWDGSEAVAMQPHAMPIATPPLHHPVHSQHGLTLNPNAAGPSAARAETVALHGAVHSEQDRVVPVARDADGLELSNAWGGFLGVFFCFPEPTERSSAEVLLPPPRYSGWAYALFAPSGTRLKWDDSSCGEGPTERRLVAVASSETEPASDESGHAVVLVDGFATAMEAARARARALHGAPPLRDADDEGMWTRPLGGTPPLDPAVSSSVPGASSDAFPVEELPESFEFSAEEAADLRARVLTRRMRKSAMVACSALLDFDDFEDEPPPKRLRGIAVRQFWSGGGGEFCEGRRRGGAVGGGGLVTARGRVCDECSRRCGCPELPFLQAGLEPPPRGTSVLGAPPSGIMRLAGLGAPPSGGPLECSLCASSLPEPPFPLSLPPDQPSPASAGPPATTASLLSGLLPRLGGFLVGDATKPAPSELRWRRLDRMKLVLSSALLHPHTQEVRGRAGWVSIPDARQLSRRGGGGWAASTVAPVLKVGVHAISFRIDPAEETDAQDGHNTGGEGPPVVGVVDASGEEGGWGVCAADGLVYRMGTLPDVTTVGGISFGVGGGGGFARPPVPLPPGQQLPRLASLRSGAQGTILTLVVDMELRGLGVSLNGGPVVDTGVVLPTSVRPFASLGRSGDSVSLLSARFGNALSPATLGVPGLSQRSSRNSARDPISEALAARVWNASTFARRLPPPQTPNQRPLASRGGAGGGLTPAGGAWSEMVSSAGAPSAADLGDGVLGSLSRELRRWQGEELRWPDAEVRRAGALFSRLGAGATGATASSGGGGAASAAAHVTATHVAATHVTAPHAAAAHATHTAASAAAAATAADTAAAAASTTAAAAAADSAGSSSDHAAALAAAAATLAAATADAVAARAVATAAAAAASFSAAGGAAAAGSSSGGQTASVGSGAACSAAPRPDLADALIAEVALDETDFTPEMALALQRSAVPEGGAALAGGEWFCLGCGRLNRRKGAMALAGATAAPPTEQCGRETWLPRAGTPKAGTSRDWPEAPPAEQCNICLLTRAASSGGGAEGATGTSASASAPSAPRWLGTSSGRSGGGVWVEALGAGGGPPRVRCRRCAMARTVEPRHARAFLCPSCGPLSHPTGSGIAAELHERMRRCEEQAAVLGGGSAAMMLLGGTAHTGGDEHIVSGVELMESLEEAEAMVAELAAAASLEEMLTSHSAAGAQSAHTGHVGAGPPPPLRLPPSRRGPSEGGGGGSAGASPVAAAVAQAEVSLSIYIMCVCVVCASIYIYMYVFIDIDIAIYPYIYIASPVAAAVAQAEVSLSMCVCVCACISIYIYIYICIYIYIYPYTHICIASPVAAVVAQAEVSRNGHYHYNYHYYYYYYYYYYYFY